MTRCLTLSKCCCSSSSPDIRKLLSAQMSRSPLNTPPTRLPLIPLSISIWPLSGYFGCSQTRICSYSSRFPTNFSSSSTNSFSKLNERFFCGRHAFWYDLRQKRKAVIRVITSFSDSCLQKIVVVASIVLISSKEEQQIALVSGQFEAGMQAHGFFFGINKCRYYSDWIERNVSECCFGD